MVVPARPSIASTALSRLVIIAMRPGLLSTKLSAASILGSMLPKIEAALNFVESKPGRIAIITSLDKAVDAIEGRAGTTITE